MKSFRAVYQPEMKASSKRFCVHVIGYRMTYDHLVNVPTGVDCTFIHMFHSRLPVITKDGIRELEPNTMLFYQPHRPLYHGYAGKAYCHSWIRCSGHVLESIFAENGIPYHTPIHFADSQMNEQMLLTIHREMHHPKGMDPGNAEDLFRIWMRNIRRESDDLHRQQIPLPFLQAKQLVETNYLENITLEGIAHETCLSKSHLCKGFRKYFAMSPIDYVIQLRLQHAIDLFAYVDMNITEIAEASGFRDVFYFSRMFKKHLGLSPNQYRRQVVQA